VGPAAAAISAGGSALPEGQTEYLLVGAAILIAIAGIAFAFMRLDTRKLVPARDAAPEHGAGRVLLDKYYVDEAYDAAIVRPTVGISRNILWRGIDAGIIDGLLVNGSAWFARGIGWIGSQFQSGQTGSYAWGFVIGVLLLLGAFTLR
jgi:NADH-quinone oxidoreductase subunit L